jgi:hypothetical protein
MSRGAIRGAGNAPGIATDNDGYRSSLGLTPAKFPIIQFFLPLALFPSAPSSGQNPRGQLASLKPSGALGVGKGIRASYSKSPLRRFF